MTSTLASKDDNAALWLHNKLGSSTHLWSFSSTVASQYTVDKLQSIRDCFTTLDSLVKFKFFLSLFHIPKRNFDEFKPIVQEIIENTIQTCLDQWVLSIAMFVQTYWMNQSLDTNLDYDLESFKEAIFDLKRILKECIETESGCERSRFVLPLEFDYLNKEARLNLLPNNTSFSNEFLYSLTAPQQDDQSLFKKHFNLFKSSKTIAKLDDLKLKASHYSKSKTTKSLLNTGLMSSNNYTNDSYSSKIFTNTSNISSFSSTKSSNNTSSSFFKRSMLSSVPSTTTITGKSSAAPKRIGGIKLLDVQEQPATPKEAKRKRKELEKETLKKQKVLEQQQSQHAPHQKQQTISQLIEQKESEDDQLEDEQAKIENTNVSSSSVEIKNNSFNNNNMNMNTSYDDLKSDNNIIKSNNDLLLSSATSNNSQLASITNQTNLINDTNPFQNKSTNIDQFHNNNTNSNNYFSNSNSSHLLLNQQFQQMQHQQQQQQQQQQPQQMDLLFQPLNNHSPIQQRQQQQSPMLAQMPTLNTVLIQSDMNLIRSPQHQQQQQHLHQLQQQQSLQQIELLQSFRTNTLNQNINNQNIINNNLINFNKNLQINNSTPTKLEQFTINPNPSTPTSPMIYSNFNPNTSLNALYTSPLASSNPHLQHQQQQQEINHQQQQQQQPIQQMQQQHQTPPQQSLTLTREQMLQAQEMFTNSNKLSRPEKALILGFIAGSRENPRPEHGPLITIKLNESEETLTSNGQQHRVLSELYFQMNYDTGEYKKIKKLKPIVLNS